MGVLTSPILSWSATAASTYFLWRYFFPRQARGDFDSLLELRRDERILVIAPHSDDEALACGGLIWQATAQGHRVDVALVTNGDGFPLATGQIVRRAKGYSERLVQLGFLRQRETLAGCAVLGVPEERVHFLGYPDRGIHRMWSQHWEADHPLRSPYTAATHSPYPNSLRSSAPHAGESLVGDLMHLFNTLRPTMVLGPHPNDVHIDHWSVHNAVRYALALHSLETGQSPRYLGYLVHRGNWPAPKGVHLTKPLIPPGSMLGDGWHWLWYPLAPEATQQKHQAILAYESQVNLLRRYMLSFPRVNELYAPFEPSIIPSVHNVPAAGKWERTPAYVPNPVKDTMVRRIHGGADIAGLDVARYGDRLLLHIGLQGVPQLEVTYDINIRAIQPIGSEAFVKWCSIRGRIERRGRMPLVVEKIVPEGTPIPRGLRGKSVGKELLIEIPGELFGQRPLLISAECRYGGLVADRTGWHLFHWENPERASSQTSSNRSGSVVC